MFYFLLAIALLGALGMTVFFPTLSVMFKKEKAQLSARVRTLQPHSILVAIPAHNEEKTIAGTIESIQEAAASYTHLFPGSQVRILVGLDGCTDETERIVRLYPEIQTISSSEAFGKWAMLKRFVTQAVDSEWIVFADSGVLWPSNLLIGLSASFSDPDVVGINPTYRNPNGGFFENCSWHFECFLKGLEGKTGGPVSAHGATVAYRVATLRKTFRVLGNQQWFNDDIVIPLRMRMLFPESRFEYLPAIGVADAREAIERTTAGAEFRRRIRMVAGNAQWMSTFLPHILKRNPLLGIIALRRVFRLFWAYWGLFFALGMLGVFTLYASTTMLFTAIGLCFVIVLYGVRMSTAVRGLLQAAIASLVAPYYLFNSRTRKGVAWK